MRSGRILRWAKCSSPPRMDGPHAHCVRCPPRDARASRAKPRPAGRVCERGWRSTPHVLGIPRARRFGRPGGRNGTLTGGQGSALAEVPDHARRSEGSAVARIGRRGDARQLAQEGGRGRDARRKSGRRRNRQGRARIAGAAVGRAHGGPAERRRDGCGPGGHCHHRHRREVHRRGDTGGNELRRRPRPPFSRPNRRSRVRRQRCLPRARRWPTSR